MDKVAFFRQTRQQKCSLSMLTMPISEFGLTFLENFFWAKVRPSVDHDGWEDCFALVLGDLQGKRNP